jgi:hypothetical protein
MLDCEAFIAVGYRASVSFRPIAISTLYCVVAPAAATSAIRARRLSVFW